MKRRLSLIIRIAVAIGLLTAIFRTLDIRVIANNIYSIQPFIVIMLCITAILDRILMAYKWNLLLRTRGISLSMWKVTCLFYIGHLLGTFTPGALGADVYRVTALSRFRRNKAVASTLLLERFIGLSVIGMFAVAGLPFSVQYLGAISNLIVWTIVVGVFLIIAMVLVSLRPTIVEKLAPRLSYLYRFKIIQKCKEFYYTYAENRFYSRTLIVFTMLSVLETVVVIMIIYLAAKAFGINISFVYFLCVMPLVLILTRLPISVQGIGVQEGLFAYCLIAAGFSAADGISISILLRLVEIVSVVLPACIFMWLNPLRLDPNKLTQ